MALPPEENDVVGIAEPVSLPERRLVITDAVARHSGPARTRLSLSGTRFALRSSSRSNEPLNDVAFGCELLAATRASSSTAVDTSMPEYGQVHNLALVATASTSSSTQLRLLDQTYTINDRIQDAGGGVVHARLEPAASFAMVSQEEQPASCGCRAHRASASSPPAPL